MTQIVPPERLSRATDPRTSAEAIAALERSGARLTQAQTILSIVRGSPGLTAGEIAGRAGLRQHAHRRLNDLRLAGLIKKGPSRRCRADLTNQVTWWPVTKPEEPTQGDLL